MACRSYLATAVEPARPPHGPPLVPRHWGPRRKGITNRPGPTPDVSSCRRRPHQKLQASTHLLLITGPSWTAHRPLRPFAGPFSSSLPRLPASFASPALGFFVRPAPPAPSHALTNYSGPGTPRHNPFQLREREAPARSHVRLVSAVPCSSTRSSQAGSRGFLQLKQRGFI